MNIINTRARSGAIQGLSRTDRFCRERIISNCDFPCFYVVFSFFNLNFIFFQLYFHGADNWNMNYRHHELIDLKSFYAGI